MKKISLVMIFLLCLVAWSTTRAGLVTKVENPPLIFQATGSNDITLAPTLYPRFQYTLGMANDDICGAHLESVHSLAAIPGATTSYAPVTGLSLTVNVPEGLRQSSKLLINWTLRVEGEAVLVNPQIPDLCGPTWGGTINQTFKNGQVSSQAYVDMGSGYVGVGEASIMTVPDAGTLISTVQPVQRKDPTHSGSCLIDSPGTGFPAAIGIKIYWKNNSCLTIISQANYRSLVVTLAPEGK